MSKHRLALKRGCRDGSGSLLRKYEELSSNLQKLLKRLDTVKSKQGQF